MQEINFSNNDEHFVRGFIVYAGFYNVGTENDSTESFSEYLDYKYNIDIIRYGKHRKQILKYPPIYADDSFIRKNTAWIAFIHKYLRPHIVLGILKTEYG